MLARVAAGASQIIPELPIIRSRGEGEQRATFFELFFDLVYVFAVTQLSHHLLARPQLVGRGRDGVHARRAVLGVELHDVDDQLVRPGHGAGPARAGVRDAREPADGGRDPGGIRRARAAVRVRLLGSADRAQRVRRRGHAARGVQPELPPDPGLERALGATVGGGRRRRRRGVALGAVAGCSRARPRRRRSPPIGCRARAPRR